MMERFHSSECVQFTACMFLFAGTAQFLKYIYKTYPPKNPGHKMFIRGNKFDVGKATQKAILHYHPDKQDFEKHGKKWYVFCEEITKRLTARYVIAKGAK